jgi:hypothetical protein
MLHKDTSTRVCKSTSYQYDDRIQRTVYRTGKLMSDVKQSASWGIAKAKCKELIVNVDGGHLPSKDKKQRSFEAMIGTAYLPSAVKVQDKYHTKITRKTCVASAQDDKQEAMKKLFKNACLKDGMSIPTKVTALTDGAKNCWGMVDCIDSSCHSITQVLDWFHIGKKFKEREHAIPDALKDLYHRVKWHLCHGQPEASLLRLGQLKENIANENTLNKLKTTETYIKNNAENIVNYHRRRLNNQPYTSNVAESNVNTLINSRQKKNQKMQWTREGAHDILQLRTSIFSDGWAKDWCEVKNMIYRDAA